MREERDREAFKMELRREPGLVSRRYCTFHQEKISCQFYFILFLFQAGPGGFGIGLGIGIAVASPLGNFVVGEGTSSATGK